MLTLVSAFAADSAQNDDPLIISHTEQLVEDDLVLEETLAVSPIQPFTMGYTADYFVYHNYRTKDTGKIVSSIYMKQAFYYRDDKGADNYCNARYTPPVVTVKNDDADFKITYNNQYEIKNNQTYGLTVGHKKSTCKITYKWTNKYGSPETRTMSIEGYEDGSVKTSGDKDYQEKQ